MVATGTTQAVLGVSPLEAAKPLSLVQAFPLLSTANTCMATFRRAVERWRPGDREDAGDLPKGFVNDMVKCSADTVGDPSAAMAQTSGDMANNDVDIRRSRTKEFLDKAKVAVEAMTERVVRIGRVALKAAGIVSKIINALPFLWDQVFDRLAEGRVEVRWTERPPCCSGRWREDRPSTPRRPGDSPGTAAGWVAS